MQNDDSGVVATLNHNQIKYAVSEFKSKYRNNRILLFMCPNHSNQFEFFSYLFWHVKWPRQIRQFTNSKFQFSIQRRWLGLCFVFIKLFSFSFLLVGRLVWSVVLCFQKYIHCVQYWSILLGKFFLSHQQQQQQSHNFWLLSFVSCLPQPYVR